MVLLLALASYSIGLCASIVNQGVDELTAMFVAVIGVIAVIPSGFLAWAFRLRQRSHQADHSVPGWSHIGLYAFITIYCGFWLAVPFFESRWGFSSALVAPLGALSIIGLFIAALSSFLPRNKIRQVASGDTVLI